MLESFPLSRAGGVRLTEPLGYLEFMKLVANARFVMTDSGGIQEETTYLGVPCLTLRTTTERPVTVEVGTNRLVALNRDAIVASAELTMNSATGLAAIPQLWDGKTADRILDILSDQVPTRSTPAQA